MENVTVFILSFFSSFRLVENRLSRIEKNDLSRVSTEISDLYRCWIKFRNKNKGYRKVFTGKNCLIKNEWINVIVKTTFPYSFVQNLNRFRMSLFLKNTFLFFIRKRFSGNYSPFSLFKTFKQTTRANGSCVRVIHNIRI